MVVEEEEMRERGKGGGRETEKKELFFFFDFPVFCFSRQTGFLGIALAVHELAL